MVHSLKGAIVQFLMCSSGWLSPTYLENLYTPQWLLLAYLFCREVCSFPELLLRIDSLLRLGLKEVDSTSC